MRRIMITLLLLITLSTSTRAQTLDYDVGVFYMPFWDNLNGVQYTGQAGHNWDIIGKYDTYVLNNNKPASWIHIPMNIYWPSPVWYDETMWQLTDLQLKLMKDYGLDFVIYDSFFQYQSVSGTSGFWTPYWSQVLENWKDTSLGFSNHGVNFAIMWANDFETLIPQRSSGCSEFFSNGLPILINYWKQFVTDSRYKKIDGKPAFYILNNGVKSICNVCGSNSFFPSYANTTDKKTSYFLHHLEESFLGAGNEMYFVSVIAPFTETSKYYPLIGDPFNGGYDATTAYGYKYFTPCNGTNDTNCERNNPNYTYQTMQNVYSLYYDYILNYSLLPYQVPVTAGWSEAPLHKAHCENPTPDNPCQPTATAANGYHAYPVDNAISTPSSFRQSLINARNEIIAHPNETKNIVTICCWNEYHEGTYIEPTGDGGAYGWGYQYLQKVKEVFGNSVSRIALEEEESQDEVTKIKDAKIYPNPSVESVTIQFGVETEGPVLIQILDTSGQLVEQLTEDTYQRGNYEIKWMTASREKGLYLCQIKSGSLDKTLKLVVE